MTTGQTRTGAAKSPAKKARKKTTKQPAGRRKSPVRRSVRAIERLELELPPTLAQFTRRMRTRLARLEREIERTEVRYRKGFTKLLREGSHQLGRYEALGERRWRDLTTQTRRDVAKVLRRIEKAVAPPPARRKPATRKSAGSKAGAKRSQGRKQTIRRASAAR
jgi:hypothetical protein